MLALAWSRLTYFGSSSGTNWVCRLMGPGVGRGVGARGTWVAVGSGVGLAVGFGPGMAVS